MMSITPAEGAQHSQMPTAPPEPTQHPTTAFFAQRSQDREELTYFGPDEIGPNWQRSGLGQFGKWYVVQLRISFYAFVIV